MPGMIQPERELTWSEDGRLTSVSVKSLFTGRWNVMACGDSPRAITRQQWEAWQAGEYIQRALPQLSDEEREFLMTGATPDEWDVEFHVDEEAIYTGFASNYRVIVNEDGQVVRGLDARLNLRNHSPDGFCWGYTGSGPAQLALALLADAVGPNVALKLYQRFKNAIVSRWPQGSDWTYTRSQARAWAKGQLEAMDIDKR